MIYNNTIQTQASPKTATFFLALACVPDVLRRYAVINQRLPNLLLVK